MKKLAKNTIMLMSDEDYFAAEGLNYSSIKNFAISPKHYKYLLDCPSYPSEAQNFGSAVHCAILQPDLYEERYFEYDDRIDRRTKEGKAIVEQAGDREIVPSLIREHIVPEANKILDLSPFLREICVFWDDCKAKLDAYDAVSGTIYDIKTTIESTPDGFCKAFYRYKYYLQAAHYTNAIRATGNKVNAFKILTIENKPPYDVALYNVDMLYVQYGQKEIAKLIEGIRECEFNDEWQGIARDDLTIPMPNFLNFDNLGE